MGWGHDKTSSNTDPFRRHALLMKTRLSYEYITSAIMPEALLTNTLDAVGVSQKNIHEDGNPWEIFLHLWPFIWEGGSQFSIKILSQQFRKSHCGDKIFIKTFHLYNWISYTDKHFYIEIAPDHIFIVAADVLSPHSARPSARIMLVITETSFVEVSLSVNGFIPLAEPVDFFITMTS